MRRRPPRATRTDTLFPSPARFRSSRDARAGDRGAIALVGPSRSGKTTAVVSGILEWDGPAVLSSVKDDLLRVTAGHRGELGDVAIFDPTESTGLDRKSTRLNSSH